MQLPTLTATAGVPGGASGLSPMCAVWPASMIVP